MAHQTTRIKRCRAFATCMNGVILGLSSIDGLGAMGSFDVNRYENFDTPDAARRALGLFRAEFWAQGIKRDLGHNMGVFYERCKSTA